MTLRSTLPFILSAGLLGACSTAVPVTANPERHQAESFGPASLSAGVSAALPKGAPAQFRRMEVLQEIVSDDEKVQSRRSFSTLVNYGNGLISRRAEISRNDIPFAITFGLFYNGFVPLRQQTMLLSTPHRGEITEAKTLSGINALPVKADETMTVKITQGYVGQFINHHDSEYTCTFKRSMPAAELHPKFQGQAIELECAYRYRNVLEGRSTVAMLLDYGVGLQTEYRTARYKDVSKVLDVAIMN